MRVLTFILNKVVKNWGNLSGGVKRSDLHLKSFFFFFPVAILRTDLQNKVKIEI